MINYRKYIEENKLYFESLLSRYKLYTYTSVYHVSGNASKPEEIVKRYLNRIYSYIRDSTTDRRHYDRRNWIPYHPILFAWLDLPGVGSPNIDKLDYPTVVRERRPADMIPVAGRLFHHHGVLAIHKDTDSKFSALFQEEKKIQLPERCWLRLNESERPFNFARSIFIDPLRQDEFDTWLWYATKTFRARGTHDGFDAFGKRMEEQPRRGLLP